MMENDMGEHIRDVIRQIDRTRQKAWEVKKLSTLPMFVITAMAELEELGMGKLTDTFGYAIDAAKIFYKLEKKRVEYVAAQRAYFEQFYAYLDKEENLLIANLVQKHLEPMLGTPRDPLGWFMIAPEVIELCRLNGVALTLSTLRKYQALGLIPKPIRIGRVAGYSVLTAFRTLAIGLLKKKGAKLSDMPELIEGSMRLLLNNIKDVLPKQRTWGEEAVVAMLNLMDTEPKEEKGNA